MKKPKKNPKYSIEKSSKTQNFQGMAPKDRVLVASQRTRWKTEWRISKEDEKSDEQQAIAWNRYRFVSWNFPNFIRNLIILTYFSQKAKKEANWILCPKKNRINLQQQILKLQFQAYQRHQPVQNLTEESILSGNHQQLWRKRMLLGLLKLWLAWLVSIKWFSCFPIWSWSIIL